MLSTLNHYQRARKHNNDLIKRLISQQLISTLDLEELLIKKNTLFAKNLPFYLPFDFAFDHKTSVQDLFNAREKFDNELIRIAVSLKDKDTVKTLIINHIKIEEGIYRSLS